MSRAASSSRAAFEGRRGSVDLFIFGSYIVVSLLHPSFEGAAGKGFRGRMIPRARLLRDSCPRGDALHDPLSNLRWAWGPSPKSGAVCKGEPQRRREAQRCRGGGGGSARSTVSNPLHKRSSRHHSLAN